MGVFLRSANMKLPLIFCLTLRLSLSVLNEIPEQDLEQHQAPVEYYEAEDQYQQVYEHSNPEGVEVSDYPEYQQYIEPVVVVDEQRPVYTSDGGQYEEQQYDPYLNINYPQYGEIPAAQYLVDEERYQTNYHD